MNLSLRRCGIFAGLFVIAFAADSHLKAQQINPGLVSFSSALHFISPDGSDVVAEPGNYLVSQPAEEALTLAPEHGNPITLHASAMTHSESIAVPQAVMVPGQDGTQDVVLLLPNGIAWHATGTETGTRTRGPFATPLSQAKIHTAVTSVIPHVAQSGAVGGVSAITPNPVIAGTILVPFVEPSIDLLICANENPADYLKNFKARKLLYQLASLKSYYAAKTDAQGQASRTQRWFNDPNAIWKIADYNASGEEELNQHWWWEDSVKRLIPTKLNIAIARIGLGRWPWKNDRGEWWLNSKNERDWTAQRILEWWDDSLHPLYPYGHSTVKLDPECEARTKWCPRNNIEQMPDATDFGANERVRLLYLLPQVPTEDIPAAVRRWIEDSFLKFKFWIDEPPARPCDTSSLGVGDKLLGKGCPEEMTFWSENHSVLFATAEYLIGQYFANHSDSNRRGIRFRDAKTGADHRDKAARRLRRWLDEHMKFGFNEWNSPGYYEYDIVALLNLIDFVRDDEDIRKQSLIVFDLLVFDLARFTQSGSFGATAGRAYQEHKTAGWEQSVGDSVQILFGTRCKPNRPAGDSVFPEFLRHPKPWMDNSSPAAHALATSTYEPPAALLSIGHDQRRARSPQESPFEFVDRSRVSLNFDEAADYGIAFDNFEDGLFWWSKSAYFTKHTIRTSDAMVKAYGNLHGLAQPFRWLEIAQSGLTFLPIPGLPALNQALGMTLEEKADRLSFLTEGMVATRANLYTYRNEDVLLSSAQNFRKGQVGAQLNTWQATFDPDVAVFSTYPASHAPVASHDGPHYWTGNAVNPRAVQYEDAAIIAYAPHPAGAQAALFHHRTHLWFPAESIDLRGHVFRRVDPGTNGFALDGKLVNLESSYFDFAGPGHFDQVCPPPPWLESKMGCEPIDYKGWTFGRKNNGFIGVYSAQPCSWTSDPMNPWRGKELMCNGLRNVFIVQVGNQRKFGSFKNFITAVSNARINISKGVRTPVLNAIGLSDVEASYDIPNPKGPSHRLELHYDQESPRLDGKPYCDDEFPRFENPYAKVAWREQQYTIQHGPFKLCHNQATGERSENCP